VLEAILALSTAHRTVIFEPPLFADVRVPQAILTRFDQEMAEGNIAGGLVAGMHGAQMGPRAFNIVPSKLLQPLVKMAMAQEDRRGTNGSPIVVASRTASHSSCDGSFAPIVGIRPCGAGHLAHHELSSARHRGGGVEGRPWLGLWMTVHSVLMILAGNCLRCGGRQSRRCPALDWRGPDRRRASDRGGCRAAGGFPDRGGRSARSRLRGDGCVSASTVGLGSELCS
jgi:hypothetical protein